MRIRRVVTGHAGGRSVFASDAEIDPATVALLPGAEFHRLWGADQPPVVPTDGTPPGQPTYFPPPGGCRFGFFTLPPSGAAPLAPAPDVDIDRALTEAEAALPGLLAHMEPDEPGMHTTDTVDFEVVISGELVLELDDGATKTLRPGDTVVQNGTRHRWHNPGTEPVVVAVFMVGASRG